jgi:hypothetical protein
MGSVTRIKQWTFDTADDYTLATDATIAASVLSMTAPQFSLPFGGQRWSVVPDVGHYDGNNDLVLQNGVEYRAQESGADLSAADGRFVFWAKRGIQAGTKKLEIRFRYDAVGNAKLIADMVDGTGGRILNSDGGVAVADSEWFDDWNELGTWREFLLNFIGDDATLQLGACRSITSRAVDRITAGTVALTQDDGNNPITVGNGGVQNAPYFAYRRQGTCELKAANAYRIPRGTTALGRLTLVADRLGGGTEPLDLSIEFKIDDGAWTALPADGDLSGESFTAGVSMFLWRLSTMDNANDCRYVPSVYAVFLSYEGWYPTPANVFVDDTMETLETLLTDNATLAAISGYDGAKICQRGNWYPQLQGKALIYICAITSTPIEMAQGTQHDQAWDWEHTIYLFPTTSEQQPDLREALMKDTVGLYKFSKLVFDALALMDMGSTFRFTDISNVVFDPNEVQGPHDNMAMIQITVRSKAEAR